MIEQIKGSNIMLNQFQTQQNDLTIIEVESLEVFKDLEEDWDELFNRSLNATVFQSFVWNYDFYKREKHTASLMILLIKDKNELVGIAPLKISKTMGIPKIEFIGSSFSGCYLNILMESDREDICQAIGKYIAERFDSAIVYIPYYNAVDFSINVFIASLMANGWSGNTWVRNISHYINEIKNFDNFYLTISSKAKSNIRRLEKNLGTLGAISILKYTHTDVNEELLSDIKRILLNSWLYERGAEQVYFGANTEVLLDMARKGYLEIFTISIDQKAIGYTINILSKNAVYLYMTAFDRNYGVYAPGKLILKHVLEECLNNHLEFDFLFGQGDYKIFWANRTKFILSCVCYKGIMGALFGYLPYKVLSVVQTNMKLRNYARISKMAVGNVKHRLNDIFQRAVSR
jgi:CelD/BcsL family acetyltransferase involved in cellulose biosynthesis